MCRGVGPGECGGGAGARHDGGREQARPLDADEASDLPSGDSGDGAVSLLRSGRLGDWTFCVEEDGAVGSWTEVLTQLSRGTETYNVLTTEGLDVFQYWRDGECLENFEPGMEHTRPEQTGTWWERVEAALAAHEGDDTGMASVVAMVLDHCPRPPRHRPGRRRPRRTLAHSDARRGRRAVGAAGRHLRG
ncbi:DUF6461 domain-containing protein [Streptomyces sviceus]|uniref:DUF6461 domain-containing protein n=1 Tax=Streptomyces sviceus TaxID=285530 RepID=UPI003698F255